MKTLKIKTVKSILSLGLFSLFLASCAQNTKLDNSSTVEAPDQDIHTAVLYNNIEAVKQHIAAGSDINTKEPMGGSTPLISAITFDKPEIVKALIEAGADIDIQNNDGSSALHVASFFGRVEFVQMLIDADADRTLTNNFGATPIQTVSGPFADMKPVYEMLQQQLGPLGLDLDLASIEKSRAVIAMMLQ